MYESDDFWEEVPSPALSQENTRPHETKKGVGTKRKRDRTNSRNNKRQRLKGGQTDDVPPLSLGSSTDSDEDEEPISPTPIVVWRKDRADKVWPLVREGEGEKVSLLSDWRERFKAYSAPGELAPQDVDLSAKDSMDVNMAIGKARPQTPVSLSSGRLKRPRLSATGKDNEAETKPTSQETGHSKAKEPRDKRRAGGGNGQEHDAAHTRKRGRIAFANRNICGQRVFRELGSSEHLSAIFALNYSSRSLAGTYGQYTCVGILSIFKYEIGVAGQRQCSERGGGVYESHCGGSDELSGA